MPHTDHDTTRLLAKIAALEQLLEEHERSVLEQAEKLQAHEETLRHERDLSREYIDIAGVMLLVLNVDQTVRLINKKGCEILGCRREEVIGKRWVDHFLPERDRVKLDGLFDELKAGEPLEHVENPVLTKDGRERMISWHNTVLRDASGAITGTLSSGEDITERKRVEDQVRFSEEKYRSLFETSQDGLVFVSLDGRIQEANQAYLDMLGYTLEEIRDMTYQQLTPARWAPMEAAIVKDQILGRGHSDEYEKEYIRKNGTVFPISVRGWSVRDKEGRPMRILGIIRDITERKRMEEKFRQAQDELQLAIKAGQIGLWSWNLITNETYLSPTWKAQLGYADEEIPNRFEEWESRLHPEDRERTIERTMTFTKNPWPNYSLEIRLRHKDGSYRWILVQAGLQKDAAGQSVKMMGCHIDITERKRIEQALRTSEARLGLIARSTKDLLWEWNLTTNEIWWNESIQTALGYRAEEIEPGIESWVNRIHPDDRVRIESSIHAALDSGQNDWTGEYRFRLADGSYNHFLDRGYAIRDAQGKPVRMLGSMVNITERKRAEEQIRLVTSALETAANGVVITDAEGTIQWVNPAFTVLTGYSREEAVGQNPRVIKSGRHDQNFYAQLWSTIKAGGVWHGEIVNKRKNGSLYEEEMTISPVRNPQGTITHFVAVKQDITQRKHMEAQAGELERLTTMSQLTDGIAHEMKNPLFILTGRLQMVKEKLDHREYGALPDDLQKIETAAARMTHIAERFSRLAQHPDFMPEPTAVQAVLKQVLESLADDLAKNRITVTTALAPDLQAIQANPMKLQTAFTNLIRNAMQAMAEAHGKGNLTVTAARQDGWIVVRIQDDGPGIAPEHRARLFEPFFTTKPAGQGVGMGLWAVRATAMALRGTVACETEVGKGATFIMRLPVKNTGNQS